MKDVQSVWSVKARISVVLVIINVSTGLICVFHDINLVEKETEKHRASHRMILVYSSADDLLVEVPPSPPIDSTIDDYKGIEDVDTEVGSDDYDVLLASYMEVADDQREYVCVIDVDLALEILGESLLTSQFMN